MPALNPWAFTDSKTLCLWQSWEKSRALAFPSTAPPMRKGSCYDTEQVCGFASTATHDFPLYTYSLWDHLYCLLPRGYAGGERTVPHPINLAACTQNLSLCICYVKRPYVRCPSPCTPALASSASGKEKEIKEKRTLWEAFKQTE